MTFLTVFTAPKPFTNPHIAMIQRNAIQSWLHLGREVDVLLIGNEEGMADIAVEFDVPHLPEVACNKWGTPLVNSIFSLAREACDSPLLAYVNADILLLPDFVNVSRLVAEQAEKYLVVGQRWDLDVTRGLDFNTNWDRRLCDQVHSQGSLHRPSGSDYFIFPRSIFTDMPPFAIGRAGWDNWTIYHALQSGWPVVDATASLMIVHQNHDYSHLPGGEPHYDLEETQINAALGGGMANMYMTLDSSHEFIEGRIRKARLSLPRTLRAFERWFRPEVESGIRWKIARQFRRWRRRIA
jgi:hypothetical protein